jgi:hypothetical protein
MHLTNAAANDWVREDD